MLRRLLAPAAVAALALALAACTPSAGGSGAVAGTGTGTGSGTGNGSPGPETPLPKGALLIDVRTPDEFAAGHLEGAELLDVTSGELDAAIPGIDPATHVSVYCRSGNRSAQAEALLREAGIANVTNLGSVEQASAATGLPVVRG